MNNSKFSNIKYSAYSNKEKRTNQDSGSDSDIEEYHSEDETSYIEYTNQLENKKQCSSINNNERQNMSLYVSAKDNLISFGDTIENQQDSDTIGNFNSDTIRNFNSDSLGNFNSNSLGNSQPVYTEPTITEFTQNRETNTNQIAKSNDSPNASFTASETIDNQLFDPMKDTNPLFVWNNNKLSPKTLEDDMFVKGNNTTNSKDKYKSSNRKKYVNESTLNSYLSIQDLQRDVQENVDICRSNIGKLGERELKINDLEAKSQNLTAGAINFNKHSKKLKRNMWVTYASHLLCLGFFVIVIIFMIIKLIK